MGKQKESDNLLRNFVDGLRQSQNSMSSNELSNLLSHTRKSYAESCHISRNEWRMTHPKGLSCFSDIYYTKLVNQLIDRLATLNIPDLPDGLIRVIALTTAAYLEDLINDFGVWNALCNLYHDIYGSRLPFYDCSHDEYLPDNVNIEDVSFIVWQSFMRCGQPEDRIYSPFSQAVTSLSAMVYDEIVDEYENAPESKSVANFIADSLASNNYINIRDLCFWLCALNPLTAGPWMHEFVEMQTLKISEIQPNFDIKAIRYMTMASSSWIEAIGALGIPATSYLARMCRDRGMDSQADIISDIKINSLRAYKILSRSDKYLTLKDYTGTRYNVLKHSFNNIHLTNEFKGCAAQLVYFDGQWNLNGMMMPIPEADIDDALTKPAPTNRMPNSVKDRIHRIIDQHDGQRVFVFGTLPEFNEFMKLPTEVTCQDSSHMHNIAVLLSLERPPLIINGGAAYFKIKGNRKFSKTKSHQSGLEVLADGLPDDVAKYIQDNHLAPEVQIHASQGEEFGRAIVQNNFRFLAGFYRSKVYTINDLDNE